MMIDSEPEARAALGPGRPGHWNRYYYRGHHSDGRGGSGGPQNDSEHSESSFRPYGPWSDSPRLLAAAAGRGRY
jgi:hypothetical protein